MCMFDLVADVDAYPEFLPFCEATEITGRAEENGREIVTAVMTVGYKAIRETFESRVELNREDLKIDVDYLEGPFSHLVNRWSFVDLEQGASQIDFYLEYAFRNPALQLLMGSMFDRIFGRFVESFEQRADSLYSR